MAKNNFNTSTDVMIYVRGADLQKFMRFAIENSLFIETDVSRDDAEDAELPWASSGEEWDDSGCSEDRWDNSGC